MAKNVSSEKVKKMFVEAATKLQQGDAEGARKGLEKVAKIIPENMTVQYNLALSYQHLGQPHKAQIGYKKVLKHDRKNVDAMVNLGLAHHALKQVKEARQQAENALKVIAGHPRAHNLMGTILAEQGNHAGAKQHFEASLKSDPQNEEAKFNLSNAVLQCGDAEAAWKLVGPMLNGSPTKQQLELGCQVLLELRQFDKVSVILKALKAEYPGDKDVLILDMSFCELIKDHFQVVDKAEMILKVEPGNARVWNSLGSAYFQLDSVEKAMENYQKAIDLDPEHPEYRNNIGLTFASLGDKQSAESCYRESLALSPNYAEAYRNLVAMRKFTTVDDPDVAMVETLWQNPEMDDFNRCKLAFALGKIYDDCGLYDKAFEIYHIGNELKSKEIEMDFDQYFSHIDRISEVYSKPPANAVLTNDGAAQPIFILGMPRSGTTLVEQIISRHPQVTGCGELPCIERAIGRLEKRYGTPLVYPDDFAQMSTAPLRQETEEYFNWVYRLHEIDGGFFTDKMPFNFVHVGLIKTMFPHAAIAHCHRHPLDVITSNYFQLYGSDINFVYDLEVMAKYYVRYHQLMRHWHHVFEGELYKVQYEALVSDNENETRMLVENMGLEWDDACLDSKKSGAAVRTASIWQVRQGIYTSSKERWRRYAKHLTPAIDILIQEKVLDEELQYIS